MFRFYRTQVERAIMSSLSSIITRPTLLLLVFVVSIVHWAGGSVYAESVGGPGGAWPKSWPMELELLRKQAWTWEHGIVAQISYDIPFVNRDEFESAWSYILKLIDKGAPLTLINTEHYYGKAGDKPVGVVIFPPLKGSTAGPSSTTRNFLKVDGKIVDLNRVALPADTPIIDQRFRNKTSPTPRSSPE